MSSTESTASRRPVTHTRCDSGTSTSASRGATAPFQYSRASASIPEPQADTGEPMSGSGTPYTRATSRNWKSCRSGTAASRADCPNCDTFNGAPPTIGRLLRMNAVSSFVSRFCCPSESRPCFGESTKLPFGPTSERKSQETIRSESPSVAPSSRTGLSLNGHCRPAPPSATAAPNIRAWAISTRGTRSTAPPPPRNFPRNESSLAS